MISKEIQSWLKEKKLKDNGKYFVSFVEEFWGAGTKIFGAEVRSDIGDYRIGRIEVRVDSYQWNVEEIRFFTKDPDWNKFREKWDFRNISAKQLDELDKIVKEKFYDNQKSKTTN